MPEFTKKLLQWNKSGNGRSMPWKGESDPYKIWLSEIILQQTRVEQGWAYYERFIETFPDIQQLAKAPEKKVFKLWEGLGYYSRCRNLIETAKIIVKQYHGEFPASYEAIRKLKGIGPYTAAAIASFAFNLPYAVVDGNVERVLARYFGVTTPVDTTAGKKFYREIAGSLLDKKQPGIYNQAIMDFGAVVCKPRQPMCAFCVQQKECMSYRHGWISLLPVKEKTLRKKHRWFYYFVVETKEGRVYIRKRDRQDIWKNLYEFIVWETGKLMPHREIAGADFVKKIFGKNRITISAISQPYKQILTHQTITAQFVKLSVEKPLPLSKDYLSVKWSQLNRYPFPRLIRNYLQNPVQQLFE